MLGHFDQGGAGNDSWIKTTAQLASEYEVYLKDYADGWEAEASLCATFESTASGESIKPWTIARRRKCTPRVVTEVEPQNCPKNGGPTIES